MFKKYFKYDTKTLDYRPVNFTSGFSVVISTIILVFICGTFYGKHKKIESLTDYEKEMLVINVTENDGFSESEFVDVLKFLNERSILYIVSYDGRTGTKIHGNLLPQSLQLQHIELLAGRSSQATLLGFKSITYESLYLSPQLTNIPIQ